MTFDFVDEDSENARRPDSGKKADKIDLSDRNISSIYDTDVLEEIIYTLLDSGEYEDALKVTEHLVQVAPYNGDSWFKRGIALNNNGYYEEAVASFRKSVALNPSDSEAMLNLGLALENVGNSEDALEVFESALSVAPMDEELH
ncbi:MAG: tetratricopeptide repeat protein, partial [Chlorobiales bacterium]|nr:tetratricopeptide repeat protein [Chlorobiales bacterium]